MVNKETMVRSHVQHLLVPQDEIGRRIDNFLVSRFYNMPKSHIYKMLRTGEVRVNKKRIQPSYQLQVNDMLRLPPVALTKKASSVPMSQSTACLLKDSILYEDRHLIVINKPSGMSVHAGSTVRCGVIEAFKQLYPKYPALELVHRLDSETSGCLILAKKKSVLRELHALLREAKVRKIYWALTKGTWTKPLQRIDVALRKYHNHERQHLVRADCTGKASLTVFQVLNTFEHLTLVQAIPKTGRTHQIRVHAAYCGHPIVGDDRYGDKSLNQLMHGIGLKRLFLHARSVEFHLSSANEPIKVVAPLPKELEAVLDQCNRSVPMDWAGHV